MKEKKPYKASKVKLDKKTSLFAYAIALVIAVAARTIQLMTNMNFATGKYIDPSPAKNYTVFALVIGFALIFFTMIFGQSRDKAIKSCILINPMRLRADRLNKKVAPQTGAIMFIATFLIIFDIIMDLSVVAKKNAEISTEENPVFAFAGIPVLDWLVYICAIIVSITFISTGANIMKGEGFSRGNCVFLMIFPIWKLLQIFAMFSENQLVGVYSENVYTMFTAMTSAVFFIFAARFFAGFEKKHTRFWMCIFGYAASIFAAVSTIPRYIMYFALDYDTRDGMAAPDVTDIGVAVMTIAIVAVFWSTYVYRIMPKLNLTGKRRWNKTTVVVRNMQSIDED